jgi:asparaginyl-tRNA synthetase
MAIHRFFDEKGFFYLHTPLITASDCEGAGQMFRVTTLDEKQLSQKPVDYTQDFFGRQAFLTVSGQLNGEIYASALGNIYTFGPTFRAENSNTSRHLAEFWMIEPEMAFVDLNGNKKVAHELLKYCVETAFKERSEDMDFFDKFIQPGLKENLERFLASDLQSVTYTEAVDILLKSGHSFQYPVEWGCDLQSEHERYLCEKHFKGPVVVTDYPKDIKSFYMRQNEDGRTVAAMDFLVPQVGEIIGGSQREERYDVLVARLNEMGLNEKDYWWYLELRRYGSVPHSGFGLGFERLVQWISGIENIRDAIAFPRYPNHADF